MRRRDSGRGPTPVKEAVIVLSVHEDEAEAVKTMHRMARTIRARKATKRYGVFIEKVSPATWWVCMKDRGNP